ncbi:hypothetical protein TWF696_001725 [Orbilia brochopaga]|uniref:Uncharacterized protein n=1 Tax=Orbilia brochopaga TaxID=3140254 RepID=A0AAV9UA12_9PEZI
MMGSFIPLFLLLASTTTYADVGSDLSIRVYFDDKSVWSKEINLDNPQCTQIIFPARQRYAGRAPRIAAIVADNTLSMSQAPNPFDFTLYLDDSSLICDPDVDGESYDLQLPYYAPGWSSATIQGINAANRYGGPYPSSDSDSDSDDEAGDNNGFGVGRSLLPNRGSNNPYGDGYSDMEERKWPEPYDDLSRPPILQRFRDYTEDTTRPLYRNMGGRRNAVFGQYDDQETLLNNRYGTYPDDENVEFSAQDYDEQVQLERLLAPGFSTGNQRDSVEIIHETYNSIDKRSFTKRAIYEEPNMVPLNAADRLAGVIDNVNQAQPLPQDDSESEVGQPVMFFSGPASFTVYPKKGMFTQQNVVIQDVAAPPSDDESLTDYLDNAIDNLLAELYGRDSQS